MQIGEDKSMAAEVDLRVAEAASVVTQRRGEARGEIPAQRFVKGIHCQV